jgi:deoxyribonuclease V
MAADQGFLNEVKNASSVEEALAIQAKIEPLVYIPTDADENGSSASGITQILALDIAYSTRSDLIIASGILYRLGGGKSGSDEIIAEKVLSGQADFPYIPGLLAFREIPLLASIIDVLLPFVRTSNSKEGDQAFGSKTVLLCDGAGIAHPRLCGIACHLGVLYKLPSVGVAKNHLVGTTLKESPPLASQRGSHIDLYVDDRMVGSVLRSQEGVRPVFVSPGHLVSIKEARDLVMYLCQKYRLPEPIRRADHIGRLELKRIECRQDGNAVT